MSRRPFKVPITLIESWMCVCVLSVFAVVPHSTSSIGSMGVDHRIMI